MLIIPTSLLLVLAVFISVSLCADHIYSYIPALHSLLFTALCALHSLLRPALSTPLCTLHSALHSSLRSALFTPLCTLYSRLRSAFRTLYSAVYYALYQSCVLFILECCIYSVMHVCIFYGVFVYSLYRVRVFSVLCLCICCGVYLCLHSSVEYQLRCAPCLLCRLVASQLLASRALVASQLVRFVDSVLRTSWESY